MLVIGSFQLVLDENKRSILRIACKYVGREILDRDFRFREFQGNADFFA